MSATAKITVLIADDDRLVSRVLAATIEAEPRLALVGSVSGADEAIAEAIARRPDVAIVDVHMPGGGGPRAAREIRRRAPDTRVLALSAADDRATVVKMLEAGAIGYLVKGASPQVIVESIERAASGHSSLSAEVTGDVIDVLVKERDARRRGEAKLASRRTRIERALADYGILRIVGQPICSLDDLSTVGVETLARFDAPPKRGPDKWFAEATEVGLRTKLELVAASRALARLDELPDGAFLSVNVSPATVVSAGFRKLVAKLPPERVVIEITEHAPVDDYAKLNTGLATVRDLGVRLAIDDAGAGFASLRHILQLAPDFIKLDGTLVAGVEHAGPQQALAAALITFAEKIGATIVAEGIETAEAVAALRELGVGYGQGYFLGRPADAFS